MKGKKALKPGSVPSIFPFLQRKPKRELSYKRTQVKEKIAKDQVIDVNTTLWVQHYNKLLRSLYYT